MFNLWARIIVGVIVLEDKLVYDGWIKVYKRDVQGRNYDILKNHDAVSVFLLNDQEEVLLVRQYRPALMMETMEIPAGVLDIAGESAEQCAAREVLEETGVILESGSLKKILQYKPMMGLSNSTMYIFTGCVEKKKANINLDLEDDEVTEAFWMPIENLGLNIQEGNIFDSKTLMAYYYYIASK
jgi:ADP-ribose pyrophosphatase